MRRRSFCPFGALLVLLGSVPSNALSALSPQEECGRRLLMDENIKGPRILGGYDAPVGACPWHVSLQVYQNGMGYQHVCSGSLIANDSVLTAAHCIKTWKNPDFWRAVLGLHDLYRQQRQSVKCRVRAILFHSNYKDNTHENDVALFKLMDFIKFNDYIQPICLPDDNLPVINKKQCYISGWGYKKKKGRGKSILQQAEINIIPLSTCNKVDWYSGAISWNMLCALPTGSQIEICQGDSGGPLMCSFPGVFKYYLIGITSFGFGCGQPKRPGIYVRTANYRGWLNSLVFVNKNTTVSNQCVFIFLIVGLAAIHFL